MFNSSLRKLESSIVRWNLTSNYQRNGLLVRCVLSRRRKAVAEARAFTRERALILALPKAIHAPNQTDDSLTGRPNFKSKWAFFNENRDIVASSLASCLVVIAIVVWMEKIQDSEPGPAEAAKEPTSHVVAHSD